MALHATSIKTRGGVFDALMTLDELRRTVPPSMTEAGLQALAHALGIDSSASTKSQCWNCKAEYDGPPGRCASCAAQFGQHRGTKPITPPQP